MTSILRPAVPGAAFDEFIERVRSTATPGRPWRPEDGAMPAIYLSHGAPPLFDDAVWIDQLFSWAQQLPRPTGILVVSAHWEKAPLSLTSPAAGTPLVYDFAGFADRYFRMTYPTPDAHDLARLVAANLPRTERLHQHAQRGLDHGAWVPLKIMYPHADVPALQLSMPTHDPARLYALGRALRPLREEGVLIIGSGYMTHGLPFMTSDMWLHNSVPTWSADFDAWAAAALSVGDLDELSNYRSRAPGVRFAHPTVEHFTPLFVTLGAAQDGSSDAVNTTVEGYQFGLSKRSFQVQ